MLGIAFVILVHGLVIYALVTGLARKAVEVIKKPITATIIEEIKAPPPPPPPPPPPAKTCADLDDDGDGINNCDDKCVTPSGEAVGPDGCPVPPPPEPEPAPKPFRG